MIHGWNTPKDIPANYRGPLGAPTWLKLRMNKSKHRSKPTAEQVEQQFRASERARNEITGSIQVERTSGECR
jgi:head-tail adaptor